MFAFRRFLRRLPDDWAACADKTSSAKQGFYTQARSEYLKFHPGAPERRLKQIALAVAALPVEPASPAGLAALRVASVAGLLYAIIIALNGVSIFVILPTVFGAVVAGFGLLFAALMAFVIWRMYRRRNGLTMDTVAFIGVFFLFQAFRLLIEKRQYDEYTIVIGVFLVAVTVLSTLVIAIRRARVRLCTDTSWFSRPGQTEYGDWDWRTREEKEGSTLIDRQARRAVSRPEP